jgi:hypothetical protein
MESWSGGEGDREDFPITTPMLHHSITPRPHSRPCISRVFPQDEPETDAILPFEDTRATHARFVSVQIAA